MPRKGVNPDLNTYLHEIRIRVKAMEDGGELYARDPGEWAIRARKIARLALDGPDGGLYEAAMHMAAAAFMATVPPRPESNGTPEHQLPLPLPTTPAA